ncbi:hypothetical protein [Streptomyces galbus]|uniref:Uncharacterized protein n=1 Tax=Streptomyces galbus TaxID=33898 RepID=A0ABX1ITN8_STRGB|nr:hypothetical protein [Streptomyces galbus]NKQ28985.1 hypothetical protein [Streptomyces galbus]
MSNEQREQQAPPVPATRQQTPRREFAKRGALTVVSALVSGAARAVVAHLLTDDE